MSITYLKKASRTAETGQEDVQTTVQSMLDELEAGGDKTPRRFGRDFDKWEGDILVAPESLEAANHCLGDSRFARRRLPDGLRLPAVKKTRIQKRRQERHFGQNTQSAERRHLCAYGTAHRAGGITARSQYRLKPASSPSFPFCWPC